MLLHLSFCYVEKDKKTDLMQVDLSLWSNLHCRKRTTDTWDTLSSLPSGLLTVQIPFDLLIEMIRFFSFWNHSEPFVIMHSILVTVSPMTSQMASFQCLKENKLNLIASNLFLLKDLHSRMSCSEMEKRFL